MAQETKKPIEEIRQEKLKKVEALREKGINPYPSKPKFPIQTVASAAEQSENTNVAVAGRITSMRGHGKLKFFDIKDQTATIQSALKFDTVGEEAFELFKLIDTDDFIEVQGTLFTTKTGELTIEVQKFNLLSKSIRPIPEQLKDKEERYRKRYLDLLLNPETQEIFRTRHLLVKGIRDFLHDKGLVEVDLPILQPLYGGANAKPFTTHFKAIDTEAYLRIASELYHKRLVVGGYEGIFDIAKDFRNEGIDQTHYPEFSMLEVYRAHNDYSDIMDLMEELMKYIAFEVLKKTTVMVHEKEIDLNQTWRRISMTELLKEHLELDIEVASVEDLVTSAEKHNLDHNSGMSKGELVFLLFDKLIADNLNEPTWVTDYPQEVSPFAKAHPSQEGFVERFELYIGGVELIDGWSEVNDPMEQRKRFEAESYRQLDDDEEAQPLDEDFLEAMEYGLPPFGGMGTGIERLTMFFTNTWSIQETILFPFKKNINKE